MEKSGYQLTNGRQVGGKEIKDNQIDPFEKNPNIHKKKNDMTGGKYVLDGFTAFIQ